MFYWNVYLVDDNQIQALGSTSGDPDIQPSLPLPNTSVEALAGAESGADSIAAAAGGTAGHVFRCKFFMVGGRHTGRIRSDKLILFIEFF